MGFYKDCEGISFFLSVHVIFILQILLVLFIEDNENKDGNIILLLNKIIFYIILFLTFYSHLQISITDPGSIDYYNNLDIIEFYYFIYRDIISTNKNFKKNTFFELNKEEEYEDKYIPRSEEDDKKFELKTSINSKLKKEISRKFNIITTRCHNCYSVRPKDAHHCTTCHCCILDRDHHCPWINNCVGLFNKKYFILFNIYAFISVIHSSFIYYYYACYINYKTFRNDIGKNLIGIFWGLFAFIYGLFVAIMVIEQRDNVLKEFKNYNKNNENKRKLMGIKMRIIFGGEFSFKWFLPFYEGGKRQLFYFIRKKKYEMYQQRLKKEENNKEIIKDKDNNFEKGKEVKEKEE